MKMILAVSAVAIVVGASNQAAKTAKPVTAEDQLIAAYDELFNDLVAVSEGKFGITRVPSPFQHTQLGVVNGIKSDRERYDQVQRKVLDMRAKIQETSLLEDGFLPAKRGNFGPQDIWRSGSSRSNAQLFAGNETAAKTQVAEKLGNELRSIIANNPAANITRYVDGWRVRASAVFFRHNECLACPKDAKVGDPAAIVAVATKSLK
ncbi:MAG: hypothetical protein ABL949_10325 [Fimbriimonadaceae bacterium]